MSAVIIVPWRDKGDPWRRRNLEVVLKYLAEIDVAPVAVTPDGRSGSAPFNRSAAYNAGVRDNPAEVYLFHEADMIVPAEQLIEAIDLASGRCDSRFANHDPRGLFVPFTTYHYLSQADTERIHSRGIGVDPESVPEYVMNGRATGAVNVISAETMAAVGQWDETFTGWGYDDRAMVRAFHVTSGNPTRYIAGVAQHLWHVPGWSEDSPFRGGAQIVPSELGATDANRRRYELYRRTSDVGRMRELTGGRA